MASIKIKGDTSGEIVLQAPSVAGSNTLVLPSTGDLATKDASGNLDAEGLTLTGNISSSATNLQIQNSTSDGGIQISDRVNFMFDDWVFEQQGAVITPVGKSAATYRATGANQTFTVPAGVNYIYVKCWGAGGAGGSSGGWTNGSDGGGGGHTRGLIPVTPGQVLYVVCGIPGQTNWTGGTTLRYGGGRGFLNNSDNRYAGAGGGLAGIWSSSYSGTQSGALLVAGGGGGGGSTRMQDGLWGGAGGGTEGQRGASGYDAKWNYGGGGGTQTAGGDSIGTAGSAINGGYTNSNAYGGGGGGGWYGGGGGSYSESNTMAAGGGGSGYIHSSVILGETFTGEGMVPALYGDNDLPKYTSNAYATWTSHYAYGGPKIRSGSQYTNAGGGSSWIKIYY
jgi:hypothetical protein